MKKVKTVFKKRYYYIVLVIVPIIGQVLNSVCGHKNFYFNQYILFTMLIIQLFVLKKIDADNLAIEIELKNIRENNVSGSFNTKTKMLLHTTKSKIISIILVLTYIVTMFKVGCLENTITGIYGGILGAVVFYVGIQAYFRYLMLLYFS